MIGIQLLLMIMNGIHSVVVYKLIDTTVHVLECHCILKRRLKLSTWTSTEDG